jgi:ATP-dependent helicase Lhr and Lhr-like helicase
LEHFTETTSRWFEAAFARPTDVQRLGWERIAAGDHTLLIAPTGSGKTLAAFLYAIDQLTRLPADAEPGVRVLYVSPLKALAYDIDRNLRVPLAGIRRAAGHRGRRSGPSPARQLTRRTPASGCRVSTCARVTRRSRTAVARRRTRRRSW